MQNRRQMERSTKEIQKFLAEHAAENMSMDEINELLSAHIQEINAAAKKAVTEGAADSADDLMDLAEESLRQGDEHKAIQQARKALKLEPDNLDVEWFLIQQEEKEPENYLRRIRLALERGKEHLAEQGFFGDECIGKFWQILETRPYLRLKDQYISSLAEFGMLRMAAREAEEIIHLNEQDNLGVRFTLMHLYAALEDDEAAEKLLQKYNKHDEGQMLLALTLLYYKLGETDQAEKALRRLTRINKETRTFVRDLLSNKINSKLAVIRERGGYSPFSEEELIMAYTENAAVYNSAPLFLRWLARTLKI